MASPADWARAYVAGARVGRLATTSPAGQPHVIPCVYVLREDIIYSVIDEKPKSGRRLLRLRNIDATGRAALVVDHYEEDWDQLRFVLIRGPASIINQNHSGYSPALTALREKYPQYRSMNLEDSEMIVLNAERWTAWRGS